MSEAGFRSLPRNVTDTTRVLLRLNGAVRNESVSPEVAFVASRRRASIW
jgi:hypothetical protein